LAPQTQRIQSHQAEPFALIPISFQPSSFTFFGNGHHFGIPLAGCRLLSSIAQHLHLCTSRKSHW
jgi:hypothetical protein